MSWKYNFIDHTGDIAVEVEGDTFEELFTASAFAWQESVIDKNKINFPDKRTLNIEEQSYEELLVSFLDELNFLFLTQKWIMSKIDIIEIRDNNNKIKLKGIIAGENFDNRRHKPKVEIKAVTFHQMEIKRLKNKYYTRIVFDI